VCVVGDDDQMIYTWRGASAENVVRFERDFPQAQTILLEQNYRSTQTILDAAQGVVRRNRLRKNKKLWTEQGKGAQIVLHAAMDEEDEGQYTAKEVSRLLTLGQVERRSDIAVMYRTNAQSRAIEEQFLRLNIPYKVIGSRKFYERKEIKDMLAYMRLLANPHDDISLQRIINVPNRKIGPKTISDLQAWARKQNISLFAALECIERHPTLGKAAQTALRSFRTLIRELTSAIDELHLPDFLNHIAERTGYGPELRAMTQEEGLDRWGNVLELRRVAEDYTEIETRMALELFLENVALVGGSDTAQTSEDGSLVQDQNSDSVTLITLHAAKGLEFPVVFIVGMDEGSLPHFRSMNNPEEIEEERRLAYVGFTRAMRYLYLVRARRRSIFGETQYTEASRFLEDIPDDLLANKSPTSSTKTSSRRVTARQQDDDFNQDPYGVQEGGRVFGRGMPPQRSPNAPNRLPPAPRSDSSSFTVPPSAAKGKQNTSSWETKKKKEQQFKAGDRVRHNVFGVGVILKSEMEGNTEFVEAQFQGEYGKKRLSMDFAKLEKL
jgi:DNA helicase-2/ATP-dependent DNA helicase PcrA